MRYYIAILLLCLSACGFRPVHAPGGAQQGMGSAELSLVALDPIDNGRSGQVLQTELEDLLHPDNVYPTPRYRLKVVLEEAKQPIVIEQNARVSRYNLLLVAYYTLTDVNTGEAIYRSKLRRMGSYNASLSDYSTYVSENDARERAVRQLANDVVMRLAAKLS